MKKRKEIGVVFSNPCNAELKILKREKEQLKPNEVYGRTLKTLISTGTELAAYQGLLRENNFPFEPGYAAVFEVEELGSEISDIKKGNLAFCMGSHRSFQRVKRDQLLILPDGLLSEVAVFARIMGISMSTLTTTRARPPQVVLVTGLGLVGHFASKIFASCGYRVIGCNPSKWKRDLLLNTGIEQLYSEVPGKESGYYGKVALVLECSGREQATLGACRMVCKGGEVVLIGVPWQQHDDITAFELMYEVFHKYVVLRSGWEWELPRHKSDFCQNSIWDNFAAALEWLKERRVNVNGIYDKVSPDKTQSVYQELLHKGNNKLAMIFDWEIMN